ncbi:unnamed protein product [Rangifer tarandus platyrhynchus]|uniref:Uncharacterized protein n=2 Tax=Rangifer tarandus platyrhynchus TaxID=3082113 RepID=A0ABN8YWB6_RANTA|nr:unnamed protein product [Rangifer tarandus platyrhynchus]
MTEHTHTIHFNVRAGRMTGRTQLTSPHKNGSMNCCWFCFKTRSPIPSTMATSWEERKRERSLRPTVTQVLQPCKLFTCTPLQAGSRVAGRPISKSVLSQLEAKTAEASTVFSGAQSGVSQLIQREFRPVQSAEMLRRWPRLLVHLCNNRSGWFQCWYWNSLRQPHR